MAAYRCVATSIPGFVQQIAVQYLVHGYWFYVTGRIPERKDPEGIDRKLMEKYGIGISKWARARRRASGLAVLQYLRHDRFFVIMATHGRHAFFHEERDSVRDARRTPIKYGGYSISFRGGHPHVRIELRQYKLLKAVAIEVASGRDVGRLARFFRNLPFEPYAPVRRQLLNIARACQRVMRIPSANLPLHTLLRLRRRPVHVYTGSPIGGELFRW